MHMVEHVQRMEKEEVLPANVNQTSKVQNAKVRQDSLIYRRTAHVNVKAENYN